MAASEPGTTVELPKPSATSSGVRLESLAQRDRVSKCTQLQDKGKR